MPEILQQALNAATRYCAVLGQPIHHSASPAMQNAALEALGLNWRYLAFEVHPDNLRDAIAGARAMNFIGLNLTVPHKLLAVEMMDALDESATAWGAVNTIVFEGQSTDGQWRALRHFSEALPKNIRSVGHNTDADAITRSVREDLNLELKGANVLLLGAGGAGRTAALKLAAENVKELFLVNRTAEKADAIAAEARNRFPQTKVTSGYPKDANLKIDLLLNATSLGLKPGDASPLDEGKCPLRRVGSVYDMIYRPAETALLKSAKAAGCRVANGAGMLLYQGARALELWTGGTAPVAVMREALLKNIYGS